MPGQPIYRGPIRPGQPVMRGPGVPGARPAQHARARARVVAPCILEPTPPPDPADGSSGVTHGSAAQRHARARSRPRSRGAR